MNTLTKAERLSSKIAIDRLFTHHDGAMAMFPLRVCWVVSKQEDGTPRPTVRMLVSVPKKRFHRAVDRNRMKRQVREAFRLNKHILYKALDGTDRQIDIAFISITDKLLDSRPIHKSVTKAMLRISEKL